MSTFNDNPLPSLPADGERVADFLRRSSAEEIVNLALELGSDDELVGEDVLASCIWTELSTKLLDMPELVIEVCEKYVARTASSMHVHAGQTAALFLGKGHPRAETLIWDVLLLSPDDSLFHSLWDYVRSEIGSGAYSGDPEAGKPALDMDDRTTLLLSVKYARAKRRNEAIESNPPTELIALTMRMKQEREEAHRRPATSN